MARLVRIEGIEDPIGPGDGSRAVRVTEAGDGPGPIKTREIAESLTQLVVEMKVNNWLLSMVIPYLDNLKWLQPLQGNGGGVMQSTLDIDQLREELGRNS